MGNKPGKHGRNPKDFGSLGPIKTPSLVETLLRVIQKELLPLATAAVEDGDPFYSVAILRKSDLGVVAAGRDRTTTKNPTETAELEAIQSFFNLKGHPDAAECVFLCVYEPSALAMCQLTLCGFDNFVFLFPREDLKSFGVEEKSVALNVIFKGATENEAYHKVNEYWKAYGLMDLVEKCEKREELKATVQKVKERYMEMTANSSSPLEPGTPTRATQNT